MRATDGPFCSQPKPGRVARRLLCYICIPDLPESIASADATSGTMRDVGGVARALRVRDTEAPHSVIASQRVAPTGRANARPMTGSAPPDDRLREAIQGDRRRLDSLVVTAPRNDEYVPRTQRKPRPRFAKRCAAEPGPYRARRSQQSRLCGATPHPPPSRRPSKIA
jgi:hypothetical protein